MDNLDQKSVPELLSLHVALMEELRKRRVARSANNPTGDFAEHLFCKAFHWNQNGNSTKSFDANSNDGVRYQIKARRLHQKNTSRQLSAMRDLSGFDVLAAVLFDHGYRVLRAALIPVAVVRERSSFTPHTNSHRFMLRDDIWRVAGVRDVTAELRAEATGI